MPNIIEQQDLLKGLPDARLAMLLQNPVGDIPPFLVAAEAQRRQAIRQQFASEAPKESVVDTLTKQIANVPQNVNAPTRTPPMVPPTPPMQGVMALQQQQAMAEMAQQAQQPQMMRGGGMVQRYQGAGLVQPVGNRVQEIADQFNVTVEEAAQMMRNNPSLAAPRIESDLGKPFYVPETNVEPPASPLELNIPVFTTSPEEYAKRQRELTRERKYQEMENYPGYAGDMSGFQPSTRGMTTEEIMQDLAAQRRRLEMQKASRSEVEKPEQLEGETPNEFRARYEELLRAQEPSDWEKAQKWFAMSEQFLDPSKTTMQSIAGAGRAFSEAAAEQARAQREAELAYKKGMLEYDIAERKKLQDAAQAERERTTFSAKDQADILVKRSESLSRLIASKKEQMADLTKLLADPSASLDPNLQTRISALQKEIADDERRLTQVEGALSSLGESAYGPIKYDAYSLRTGFGT